MSPVPYPRSQPAPRVLALDGLRAIAVLLVLAYHCYWRVPGSPDFAGFEALHRLAGIAYCGVDLFFVLSGFLIGGILLDHAKSANLLTVFYCRRLLRIVPLYLLLLVAYWGTRTALEWKAQLPYGTLAKGPSLWTYWTFTQNIAMAWQQDAGPLWLTPTWSLAVEEQFYLLIPPAMLLLNRRVLAALALAAVVLCPLLRLMAWQGGENMLAAVFLTPARADALMLGVLVAMILRNETAAAVFRRPALLPFLALVLAVPVGLLAWHQEPVASRNMVLWGYTLVGLLSASCLLFVVLRPRSRPARFLAWAPLAKLGRISYFVYLAHTPLLLSAHRWLRGTGPDHSTVAGIGTTLLALGFTVLLGLLSSRYLESPLLALSHKLSYRSP